MNFKDLLDEDGQGTRELDAWLAENIAGYEIAEGYAEEHLIVLENETDKDKQLQALTELPHYTTGYSIDSILNLANEYLNTWTIHRLGKYEHSVEPYKHEFTTPQLALAHKLFKTYQEEKN